VRGFVYNNPNLAIEDDGYWSFNGRGPHAYWCVVKESNIGVLLAPIFKGVVDDQRESILDMMPHQITDKANAFTLLIGRCIICNVNELTTEPIFYINPDEMKRAYARFRELLTGD